MRYYAGAEHAAAVATVRPLYEAGVFRLKDFRQQKDAVTILALAGPENLRPCRVGDRPQGCERHGVERRRIRVLRGGLCSGHERRRLAP